MAGASIQTPDAGASSSDGGIMGGGTAPQLPIVAPGHDFPSSGLLLMTPTPNPLLQSPGQTTTPRASVVLHAPGASAASATGLAAPGSVGTQVGALTGSGGGLCSASTGTTPLPPYSHTRHGLSHSLAAGEEALQSLFAYVAAEAQPAEKMPTADVVWGQTERERVYNFLLHVPYQLERLLCFGSLLLADSFLGVFTLLPLRCLLALAQLARGVAAVLLPPGLRPRGTHGSANPAAPGLRVDSISSSGTAPPAERLDSVALSRGTSFSNPAAAAAAAAAAAPASSLAGGLAERRQRPPTRLSGSQLYDMLCLAILFVATAVLRAVRPGSIYYWLKDITSEFLKMSVLSTAFDISDKILSNFGNDVLEALSGTCTQWLAGKKRAVHLATDAVVAGTIVTLHALTLMCQALIVAVALNSSRNGLVALLIANNFVEIKSTVFKKWDSTRIWALVCADAVERFHLLVVLSFVVVEEMDSSASWYPPPDYLRACGLMVAAEVVIDVVKHAVLGKFNDVRPGIYREFHQDLCTKAIAAQSHSAPRLLNFHHLAPAALAMRIALTLFWLRVETPAQVWIRLLIVTVLYGVLVCAKLLFGYLIKLLAHYHVHYYSRKYGAKTFGVRPGPSSSRLAVVTGPAYGASAGSGMPPGPGPAPTPAPVPATPGSAPTVPAPSPMGPFVGSHAAPASPSPAVVAASGLQYPGGALHPHPLSPAPAGASHSQPLVELPAGTPVAMSTLAGPGSPPPVLGTAPWRLIGPAAGGRVGTASATGMGTGMGVGVGAGFVATLLAPLSGLGSGAGHAKEE